MNAVLSLLVVAWLPGWLLLRMPLADRRRRAALGAGERAFWAIVLSVAVTSLAALALAITGRYSLSRVLIADLGLATVLVAGFRTRLLYRGEARWFDPWLVVPAALVGVGLWLYFPAAEYLLGGKDPGVYFNEGIQIAQRGGVRVVDPVIAGLPPATRDLFFPSHNSPAYYGLRFVGFFVMDPQQGTVQGQFPHLYPVWVAIGYGLHGLTGAREVTGVWAILGLLALYFLGARLVGRPAAAIGAGLLAVSLVQIWFARYPNSETLMQPLLLAGLLALARAQVDGDRFFAPVAGVLLGLLLFLRIDAGLVLAAVVGALLLDRTSGRQPDWRFVLATLATSGAALVYLTRVMKPYMIRPIIYVTHFGWLAYVVLAVAGLALAGVAVLAGRPRVARPVHRWTPLVLISAVVIGAAYAYFFRVAHGRLAPHDAESLRTFTWYLPAPALLVAVAGYALVVRRQFWRDPAFLITLTAFSFFTFFKIQIVPEHFWMTRRFLPLILPGALLLFAAAATALLPDRWRGVPDTEPAGAAGNANLRPRLLLTAAGVLVAAVAAIALGRSLWRASEPVRHHVEYAGVVPHLEALAHQFKDDDLVLVESRNSSDLHVLALPLAYVYARNVLVLNSPRPDRISFRLFLGWARAKYKNVYFVGGGGTDLLSRSIGVAPVDSLRFQVPEYDSPRNAYPAGVRQKEFDFGIYRFVTPAGGTSWFSLDVGAMDDLHTVRFHAKERMETTKFRWTRDVSYVSLPGLTSETRLVTLWMNDGRRPASAGRAHVAVALDDHPLGEVDVVPGFQPYSFSIPADLAAALGSREDPGLLKLTSNTWSPRAAFKVNDDRQLGVMLERIEVR